MRQVYSRYLWLCTLSLLTSSCDQWAAHRRAEAVFGTPEWLETARSLSLVRLEAGATIEPSVRIVVRRGAIEVDNRSWLLSLPEAQREQLADGSQATLVMDGPVVQLEQFRLPPAAIPEGGFLIRPLFREMERAMSLEKRLFALRGGSRPIRGAVQLAADAATPFELIAQVLYSAAQARYDRWQLVGAKGTELQALSVPPLSLFPDEQRRCFALRLEMGSRGIHVVSHGPEERPLRSLAGQCPVAPCGARGCDLRPLADLLRSVAELDRKCPSCGDSARHDSPVFRLLLAGRWSGLTVLAPSQVRYAEVMAVLDVARREAPDFRLALGFLQSPIPSPPDCARSLSAQEASLRVSACPLAKLREPKK
jgi:hypothetical protein